MNIPRGPGSHFAPLGSLRRMYNDRTAQDRMRQKDTTIPVWKNIWVEISQRILRGQGQLWISNLLSNPEKGLSFWPARVAVQGHRTAITKSSRLGQSFGSAESMDVYAVQAASKPVLSGVRVTLRR